MLCVIVCVLTRDNVRINVTGVRHPLLGTRQCVPAVLLSEFRIWEIEVDSGSRFGESDGRNVLAPGDRSKVLALMMRHRLGSHHGSSDAVHAETHRVARANREDPMS